MAEADAGSASEGEQVISRRFEAPRERVFDAWCDPVHIGQWWGADGSSTDTLAMEVRAGGAWRFVTYGADGAASPGCIAYLEVLRPERLCWESRASGAPALRTEATFSARGGATVLALRLSWPGEPGADARAGALQGWGQALDRLARYLAGYGSEM